MNLIIDKSSLKVTSINRQPQVNEFIVQGVSDMQKDILVPIETHKLDTDGKPLFLLPQPDEGIITPTPKTVQTTEPTQEDGTPNIPIMENKSKQIPILDSEGNQVRYFKTNVRYEQQEVGQDDEGNPIYEQVEVVETDAIPTLCWQTEEYEEESGLYWTEVVEDVITYQPVDPLEINSDHELYTEDLEPVMVDDVEVETVYLSQNPEHFTYEEVEPLLTTYKQIKKDELYNQYQAAKLGQVISSLLGEDELNIVFPYGENNQNDYRSIGITFALDTNQTESIIGSDSHGKFYISREDFMTLTKEFQEHEVGLYIKMKQKESEVDTCDTIESIQSVVW